MVRVLCAGCTVLAIFRNLDLYRDRRRWNVARRAAHLISIVDSRRLEYSAPCIDRTSWLRVGTFGLPTVVSVWLLLRSGTPSSVAGYSVRWLLGALWAKEPLTPRVMVGAAIVIGAVVAVTRRSSPPNRE